LNANTWIRQIHRWLSIAFVAAVIFTSVALAQKGPMWVSYVPLLPLFLLAITGVYMFALPYVASWRGGGRAAGRA
jgi:hypothetical protein